MKGLAFVFFLFLGLTTVAQQLGNFREFYSLERSTISKLDPITNQTKETNVIDLIGLGMAMDEGDVTVLQLRTIQELDQLVVVFNEANSLVGEKKNKEWKLNFLSGHPSTVSVDKKTNKIKIKTIFEITLDGESKIECFFNVDEINKLIQLLEENKSLLS
ncbi:MAG: hypothetical protein R2780_05935 [Crocinitomicaceae bacterium]|nr:hypothetical protein [Crocinitomicaceae bacterium]